VSVLFVHCKYTKTALGIGALVNFEIEGDAGGDDPQVQSLWAYQAFGGLPSKEYYEEKPVFELYTSVVKGILLDIASHTGSKDVKPFKRDIIDFIAAEMAETEAAGWPWPWPGDDDKGGKDHPEPGKPPGKDLPLDARMERLATKVAEFERELIRAGADPEKLFNPHYSYNPYSTKAVEKALPFLDLPTYFSAFAIRSFPENITVTHPAYLKAVTNLLAKTPDYVLSGYFALRVAQEYSSALGPKTGVKKEARRLEEVLKGLKKGTEENRQDVCLNYVDEVVGYIAGKEFVKEAFSPEAKKDGETIITSEQANCSSTAVSGELKICTKTLSMRSTTNYLTSPGWMRRRQRPLRRRPRGSSRRSVTPLLPTRPTRSL
jgi:endothelin-converting enzyme